MRSARLLSLALVLQILLGTAVVHAETAVTYDESRLTSLYQSYLKKNQDDPYLEKLIANERSRIRAQANTEAKDIVSPANTTEPTDTTSLPTAIERERSVVNALEENLNERKVDLDLLNEEEKKCYSTPGKDACPATDQFRLTKTYPELLAKKAVLEERIAAFNTALPLQRDRQAKLMQEQSLDQFAFLLSFLGYAAILIGGIILDRILRRIIVGKFEQKGHRYLISKIITTVIYLLVVLWLLSKLFSEHPGAVASLAIIGAGIAIAIQDVVKDIVGWAIIFHKRPFTLGDRVCIGTSTGDVIDIGILRSTMLEVSTTGIFNSLERTGKTLYIPNSMILREPVLNYNTTSDFLNAEMQVTISYESNWRKAEQILREVLHGETLPFVEKAKRQQTKRTAHFYSSWEVSEPEVHVDIATSGILFTLKFTVPIGQRRDVVTRLSRTILERFDAAQDIDLAFNTIRVIGGNSGGEQKTS
jgi:small-conductance mechanosensitive channel